MLAAVALPSCSSDKKATTDGNAGTSSTPCSDGGGICVGNGQVVKAASGNATVTVDLTQAPKGAQYVLMPFVLGDTSTIQGATADNFTFTLGSAASLDLQPLRDPKLTERLGQAFDSGAPAPVTMSDRELDYGLRSLVNRFDPALGTRQGEGFWRLARRLDQAQSHRFHQLGLAGDGEGIYGYWWRLAQDAEAHPPRPTGTHFALDAGSCPTATGTIYVPADASGTPKTLSLTGGTIVDGGTYCMVYLANPVTGGSKTEIEATVAEVLKRAKTIIFNDTFPAVNGYTFKPIVAVLDFDQSSSAGQWPTADALQISGGFISKESTPAAMPMVYMAADFQKLKINKGSTSYDAALQKKLFHSTIAHEMNHAIVDYYRKRATTSGLVETGAVDEGLAHYVEDLYGYGAENFGGFAGGFLDVWALTAPPILHSTDDSPSIRGGAQSLWYYLISQKGGVTYSGGTFTSGQGLSFAAAVVKNASSKGPANLASNFGADWVTTVGRFFGALVLDGSTVTGVDSAYKVQNPVATVTNLNGDTGRTYGMHFVNYAGKNKIDWSTWDKKAPSTTQSDALTYYATQPFIYTVGTSGAKVTFTLSKAIANTAVSVVRIK